MTKRSQPHIGTSNQGEQPCVEKTACAQNTGGWPLCLGYVQSWGQRTEAWERSRANSQEAKVPGNLQLRTKRQQDIPGAAGHVLCRKRPFSSNCLLVSEPGDMAVNSAQIQDSRTIPWFIYRQLRLVAWGFYSFLTMVNAETFASIKTVIVLFLWLTVTQAKECLLNSLSSAVFLFFLLPWKPREEYSEPFSPSTWFSTGGCPFPALTQPRGKQKQKLPFQMFSEGRKSLHPPGTKQCFGFQRRMSQRPHQTHSTNFWWMTMAGINFAD